MYWVLYTLATRSEVSDQQDQHDPVVGQNCSASSPITELPNRMHILTKSPGDSCTH